MSFIYPQALIGLFVLLYFYRKGVQKQFLWILVLLIIALMRPVLPQHKQSQKLEAKELIIALDVSYSMRADDLPPSRLEAAKHYIKTLLMQNKKDSFSLFAFTTNPLILSPATTDHSLLIAALSSLKTDNILTHGTNLQTLLERIGTLKRTLKQLLLFSDGGDIKEITPLLALCDKYAITIHAFQTATKKGSFLRKKNGKKLKDAQNHLIITRLNPNLKKLALKSGGTYHTLEDMDASLDFIDTTLKAQKLHRSYYELFWIPALLALLIFLFSFITLPRKILLLFPFITLHTQASLLDWYHIQKATDTYHDRKYNQASKHFELIGRKTMQSQLNLANSYYQAGRYHDAQSLYSSLKTTNPHFKKLILFKLGNCAVKHKAYDKAKDYYKQALRFGKDADILYNLNLIKDKKTKQRRDFAAVASKDKRRKNTPQGNNKKQKKNKNQKSGGKKSMQNSQGTPAQGKANQKKSTTATQKGTLTHPLGYKAYERINQGYLDEKTPW